jgi:hypothetical protein
MHEGVLTIKVHCDEPHVIQTTLDLLFRVVREQQFDPKVRINLSRFDPTLLHRD